MIMSGGEMCLLLPGALTFGEKMCQIRRRSTLPRCLFGPPDPAQTEKLLQEQIQRERERFQRRWNFDLDMIEAAVEKSLKTVRTDPEDLESKTSDTLVDESRIPPLPSALGSRLSSDLLVEDKPSPTYKPTLKKSTVYKKPTSKFQKRVRVAGSIKRQTCLTEFWRSRRSLAFVFGKSKARALSLPSTKPSVVE